MDATDGGRGAASLVAVERQDGGRRSIAGGAASRRGAARALAGFVLLILPLGSAARMLADATAGGGASIRSLRQDPTERIAGGSDAPCGRFPFMASLRNRDDEHMCGGVLVAPTWVLTVAHCVDPRDPASIGESPIVAIGACDLDDEENENGVVELFQPEATVIHEGWNGITEDGFDIALLKLPSPSRFASVRLPPPNAAVDLSNLVALGWGETEGGAVSRSLRLAEPIEFVRNDVCGVDGVWGDVIRDGMLCAFSTDGAQVCKGDSGGPLLQAFSPDGDVASGRPELDLVVGLTSFGDGGECGTSERPDVFTMTSAFRVWVDSKIEDGTRFQISQSPFQDPAGGENSETVALGAAVPAVPSPQPQPPPEASPPPPPPVPSPPPNSQRKVDKKLGAAAASGKAASVAAAIALGASPKAHLDPDGATPLLLAAEGGHLAAVVLLIAAGADADAPRHSDGLVPLHLAADRGDLPVAKALVVAHADPDKAADDGVTPLWMAALKGHAKVAALLLQKGADPERGPGHGEGAPLHAASATLGSGSVAVVRDLLDHGAALEARDGAGRTPVMMAAYYGNVDALRALLEAGGKADAVSDGGSTAAELVCGCLGAGDGMMGCSEAACDEIAIEEIRGVLGW